MLELRNISKRLGDFDLKNINLEVNSKEYFVLLGASGAGKSVILEMIAGLIKPDCGEIVMDHINITKHAIHKRNIGIVFQDHALFPHMNVLSNICYPLRNIGKSKGSAANIAKQYAADLGINHLLNRMPSTLSGGEKQRVALARTLVLNPQMLLLDEPLASVDVEGKDALRALLRSINRRGITMVHVTHDYREAVALADRVAIVTEGEIAQTGQIDEVFSAPKSPFVARLTGIKNFFKATHIDSNTSRIAEKFDIKHTANTLATNGYVLFRSEDVAIAFEKSSSSIQNSYYGKVVDLFPNDLGTELYIDFGVTVSAVISNQSKQEMNINLNQMVWVSFKSTAVQFIAHV